MTEEATALLWTSQIVAAMNRKNCRNSDCQFSATSTTNSEEVTNSTKPIGG